MREKVDPDFIKGIITEQIKNEKWNDCAVLISVGKLQKEFDCMQIIDKLAEDKKISLARSLCADIFEL